MGFFSKVWKGIKGAVKSVARRVKKVAKKVVTALPGGEKLWEFGTKIGKGIEKGLGKISEKLGPLGTMALSFVLAPVMGPAIASLWSGFGAGAAAMAGSANAIVAGLGTAGTAVFNGVNFVSGTIGALGKALSEGVKGVAKGQFGAAGDAFISNMKAAFTGEAGMSSVNAGIAEATRVNQIKDFKGTFDSLPSPDEILKSGPKNLPDPDFEMGLRNAKGELFNPTINDMGPLNPELSPPVDFDAARTVPMSTGEGTVLAPQGVEAATGISQAQQGVPSGMPSAPGEGTVLKEPKNFLQKATEAVKKASDLATAGGGANAGFEAAGQEVGLRRTDISAPGVAEPIQAAGGGGSSLWDQLIAQANKQTRGGFA